MIWIFEKEGDRTSPMMAMISAIKNLGFIRLKGKRRLSYGLALVICMAILAGTPGSSQSDDQSKVWDKPFGSPQYLLHATGHGTMDGPRKDDWLFLYPNQPKNGFIELPDGMGGTFTYSIDNFSGPFNTPREVCAAVGGRSSDKSFSEWNSGKSFTCSDMSKPTDCQGSCKENTPHLTWDESSEFPDCSCICEKGWQFNQGGTCVSCDELCKKTEHSVYDPEKSSANSCGCKCELGFEMDSSSQTCKRVECPQNTSNIAEAAGSSGAAPSCPEDRKIGANCCCDEGFTALNGACVKEESGGEEYSIEPTNAEVIVGNKVEFSVVKKKLGKSEKVSNDKIKWDVKRQNSVNSFRPMTKVGEIDSSGVFSGLSCGTCSIIASVEKGTKLDAGVTVKCSEDQRAVWIRSWTYI